MRKMGKRPIQIYLRPEQYEALNELAKATGRSKADLIRESVDRFLNHIPPEQDSLMKIVGLGNSGKKDLAERHDFYVEEAVKSHRRHG